MKQNKVKAIEMVRVIRDRQYEQTKNMSNEEKIAFYQERARILMAQLKTIIDAKKNEHTLVGNYP